MRGRNKSETIALDSFIDGKCFRCGSPETAGLPNGAFYCRACVDFGAVRSDRKLWWTPAKSFPAKDCMVWNGQLTSFQEMVSRGILESYESRVPCLVHAVTGAGKTEMLYPLIDKVLKEGQTICIASPRIDVCQELHKRLLRDFDLAIPLLYGGSKDQGMGQVTIATTHQLLKYHKAFDILVVDEVDAFPYVDNPMLYYGVERVSDLTLFLTATSTDQLDQMVAKGELKRLSLARRFHGNPLVVPQGRVFNSFRKKIKKGKLPQNLKRDLLKQRKSKYPLLIFIAEIEFGKECCRLLEELCPQEKIGFVASNTEDRKEIVQSFRTGETKILLSTTILERGVTFPGVDVFVLEADHKLFTRSSLVQIAGRVGRSMGRPTGLCYFYYETKTKAINQAIREIKMMNKEAEEIFEKVHHLPNSNQGDMDSHQTFAI